LFLSITAAAKKIKKKDEKTGEREKKDETSPKKRRAETGEIRRRRGGRFLKERCVKF